MTARCPVCAEVHPIRPASSPDPDEFRCQCGSLGRLCGRNHEYEIGLALLDAGYRELRINVLSPSLTVVWAINPVERI